MTSAYDDVRIRGWHLRRTGILGLVVILGISTVACGPRDPGPARPTLLRLSTASDGSQVVLVRCAELSVGERDTIHLWVQMMGSDPADGKPASFARIVGLRSSMCDCLFFADRLFTTELKDVVIDVDSSALAKVSGLLARSETEPLASWANLDVGVWSAGQELDNTTIGPMQPGGPPPDDTQWCSPPARDYLPAQFNRDLLKRTDETRDN